MTRLETLNGEKSIATLKDYFNAVDSPGIYGNDLHEKKQAASKALDHLSVIFKDDDEMLGECNPDNAAHCPDCGTDSQKK